MDQWPDNRCRWLVFTLNHWAARSSKCRSTANHRNTQIWPHHTNPVVFALASGSPADKIQDRDAGQQVSAGTSTPVSGWALPTGGWACWTAASEVGCLRQTECATDSHNHRSQELCCFQSRYLEQPTNRPASFVTVDRNFARHLKAHLFHSTEWHMPAAPLEFFLRLRCL